MFRRGRARPFLIFLFFFLPISTIWLAKSAGWPKVDHHQRWEAIQLDNGDTAFLLDGPDGRIYQQINFAPDGAFIDRLVYSYEPEVEVRRRLNPSGKTRQVVRTFPSGIKIQEYYDEDGRLSSKLTDMTSP